MDASELLPLAAAVLFAGLCVFTWFQVGTIAKRAVRLGIRIATGLMAIAALLFSVALLVMDVGYTRHAPALVSPDGKHIAITAYTVNSGAESDIAEVSVRTAWVPYSYRVYVGPAQYQPYAAEREPSVHWTDSTHLTIRFRRFQAAERSNGEQGCAPQADGITITCEETVVLPQP